MDINFRKGIKRNGLKKNSKGPSSPGGDRSTSGNFGDKAPPFSHNPLPGIGQQRTSVEPSFKKGPSIPDAFFTDSFPKTELKKMSSSSDVTEKAGVDKASRAFTDGQKSDVVEPRFKKVPAISTVLPTDSFPKPKVIIRERFKPSWTDETIVQTFNSKLESAQCFSDGVSKDAKVSRFKYLEESLGMLSYEQLSKEYPKHEIHFLFVCARCGCDSSEIDSLKEKLEKLNVKTGNFLKNLDYEFLSLLDKAKNHLSDGIQRDAYLKMASELIGVVFISEPMWGSEKKDVAVEQDRLLNTFLSFCQKDLKMEFSEIKVFFSDVTEEKWIELSRFEQTITDMLKALDGCWDRDSALPDSLEDTFKKLGKLIEIAPMKQRLGLIRKCIDFFFDIRWFEECQKGGEEENVRCSLGPEDYFRLEKMLGLSHCKGLCFLVDDVSGFFHGALLSSSVKGDGNRDVNLKKVAWLFKEVDGADFRSPKVQKWYPAFFYYLKIVHKLSSEEMLMFGFEEKEQSELSSDDSLKLAFDASLNFGEMFFDDLNNDLKNDLNIDSSMIKKYRRQWDGIACEVLHDRIECSKKHFQQEYNLKEELISMKQSTQESYLQKLLSLSENVDLKATVEHIRSHSIFWESSSDQYIIFDNLTWATMHNNSKGINPKASQECKKNVQDIIDHISEAIKSKKFEMHLGLVNQDYNPYDLMEIIVEYCNRCFDSKLSLEEMAFMKGRTTLANGDIKTLKKYIETLFLLSQRFNVGGHSYAREEGIHIIIMLISYLKDSDMAKSYISKLKHDFNLPDEDIQHMFKKLKVEHLLDA